jgi:hypothetical protein
MTGAQLDELMDKLEDYVDTRITRATCMHEKGYDPSPDSRREATDALRAILAALVLEDK